MFQCDNPVSAGDASPPNVRSVSLRPAQCRSHTSMATSKGNAPVFGSVVVVVVVDALVGVVSGGGSVEGEVGGAVVAVVPLRRGRDCG